MTGVYSLKAQDLLYKRPLYNYIGQDEENMNVLVMGWSPFIEAFVDQCLQAGQMRHHFLNLTVLAENADEKKNLYLSARPDLDKFVNVNRSLASAIEEDEKLERYAELNFKEFEEQNLRISLDAASLELLINIVTEAPDEKYHYFVIDLSDRNLNRKVAEKLLAVVKELMPSDNNSIHYLADMSDCADDIRDIIPVYIDSIKNISDIDPNLERMAYNAHLTWDDAINGDAVAELEKFREDSYNYTSSIALALSIQYKLADIGIVLSDYHVAAEEFWNVVHKEENQDIINRIIALEHRRWVINQVCQGWTAPEQQDRQKYYDDCMERMKVKNPDEKIHPCIVRSTEKTPLSTGYYSNDPSAWNYKNDEQDALLDELDRMSIELHRRMFVKAEAYRNKKPLEQGDIPDIYKILENSKCSDSICREWERLVFCIKNILDGNYAYSRQYEKYKERFETKLQSCDVELKDIETHLSNITKKIWPVIEANLYRDYKKYDEVLVKKIPFILTYNIHLSLAMAFRTTASLSTMNDTIFRNVASATIIKPERLTYLLFLDNTVRPGIVRQMILTVRKYMSGKGINCKLNFLITGLNSEHLSKYQQWQKCFDKLSQSGCINEYRMKFVDTDQDAVEFWASELENCSIDIFDGTTNLFQSMYANGSLLQIIRDQYPYFEFDSRSKLFRKNTNCRYLSYIEDHTYLGIEEMFGLVGAEDMEFNYPVLGNEYRKLWNIYTGRNRGNKARWKDNVRYSIKCWNVMCDTLENFGELYPKKEIISLSELQASYRGYQRWNDILNIIRELAGENGGKQYLIPEKTDGKMTGFRYSNPDIKGVLTKAGDILEIYTYFTLCEKGWFDEIACGYRFRWEDEKVNNELDLVLTKGFQSLIIECKARSKLDQNFYFKLNSLVDMFGIGAHKVLLTTANTEDNDDNRMQRERGNMMGITTISEIEDIQDIAECLRELL